MNKVLFIAVTIVLVALFGTVIYYGMQALEPHTYIPPEEEINEITKSAPEATVILPVLPGLPTKKIPSDDAVTLNSFEPVKVLSTEEQVTYLATSTIREVNAQKLFFAPYDSNAFPYSKNDIFIIEKPSSLVRTSLWTINTATKTMVRVAGPSFGLMARWSKNGRYVFTMSTDTAGALSLSFIDMKLKTTTPLRIATLPSKCFIMDASPIMYCGVPQGAPEGAVLPDDYLKGKFISRDRIVKIDFKTPKVTELWNGESESLDIQNPAVIGTELFFVNKTDDSVWKLAL